jgi:hypothetical protein
MVTKRISIVQLKFDIIDFESKTVLHLLVFFLLKVSTKKRLFQLVLGEKMAKNALADVRWVTRGNNMIENN